MDSDEGDCNTNNTIYKFEAYLRIFIMNLRWGAFLCLKKVLI